MKPLDIINLVHCWQSQSGNMSIGCISEVHSIS